MTISIDTLTLCGIIAALITLIIVILRLTCVFKYYIKRKYDSIDRYNKSIANKIVSYPENIKQYKNNMVNSGAETSNKVKVINLSKILAFFKKKDT